MCGRYTDTRRNKTLLTTIGFQAHLAFTPRYNIAPTQEASIVAMSEDGTPEHKRARWGLLPVWTKGSTIPASLINARAETVATKPSFRIAFHKRRCLVLGDGFYEWQKRPKGKQPIYIRMREGKPFVFGGIWEQWRDEERVVDSFCILTVEPNELCRKVHNRMPLILREADVAAWLDASARPKAVDALLQPYSAVEMESFPVSALVNNVRNEAEECVKPIDLDKLERSDQLTLPF